LIDRKIEIGEPMSEEKNEWNITYKQIGIILISFVLGLIVALLFSNTQETNPTNFTTTELIGFVLSVILSGASIVLAIAAIALGKSSEQAVMSRSDESIRLQTEVFTRTTDALQGIKASTDVTEKRIEDIISGRAGDISKQVAELAGVESGVGRFDVKELEEQIKKSITGSFDKKQLTDEEKEERENRRKEIMKKRREYENHHDAVLLSLANQENVQIVKLGHGTPSSDKSVLERYDAIFTKSNEKIAVSTFEPLSIMRYRSGGYTEILNNLARGLEEGDITKLYLVFFEGEKNEEAKENIEKSLRLMKEEISSKIVIKEISYSESSDWANELAL